MGTEHRNKLGDLQEHHFKIDDAIQFGVIKAVLLYNFRYWLEKNKANGKETYKHTDGNSYYWTYNSGEAFAKLFPYLKGDSIARYLRELEKEGILISGNFNKMKYDRTKWYSIPELYKVEKKK